MDLKNFGTQKLSKNELQEINGGIIFTIMLAIGVGAAAYGLYNYVNE